MTINPYVDLPLWGSEAEDEEQQVVAWIDKLAQECLSMAEQIADAFDQYPEHWKPDMLTDVERVHHELVQVLGVMKKAGLRREQNV